MAPSEVKKANKVESRSGKKRKTAGPEPGSGDTKSASNIESSSTAVPRQPASDVATVARAMPRENLAPKAQQGQEAEWTLQTDLPVESLVIRGLKGKEKATEQLVIEPIFRGKESEKAIDEEKADVRAKIQDRFRKAVFMLRFSTPTDLTITEVQMLASRLRALKMHARILAQDFTVWTAETLDLDASSTTEELETRARRMQKLRYRAQFYFQSLDIRVESVSSYIEMLQAAEQVKPLARAGRETIYANGQYFVTRYPWGAERLWSAAAPIETKNFEPGLEHHPTRWKALNVALQPFKTRDSPKLIDSVSSDFGRAEALLCREDVRVAVDKIIDHPEFVNWLAGDSGGLVIQAYDVDYLAEAWKQSTALQKLYQGRQATSAVSGFPWLFMKDFKGPGHVMLHAAGMCNTFRPDGNDNVVGCRGLLRSLCAQLIAQPPYQKQLKLTRLTLSFLDQLRKPSVRLHILLKLFRDLILDVAEYATRIRSPTVEIIVIIDGIDWFENARVKTLEPNYGIPPLVSIYKEVIKKHSNESPTVRANNIFKHRSLMTAKELMAVDQWMLAEKAGEVPVAMAPIADEVCEAEKRAARLRPWQTVVQFFRMLVDECNTGDLGNIVHFRYMLLHPWTSKISANSSVLERYISLDEEPELEPLVESSSDSSPLDTSIDDPLIEQIRSMKISD